MTNVQSQQLKNKQMEEENSILKRTEGKLNGNIKKGYFFKYYSENAKQKKVNVRTFNAVLKDLLSSYSESIITEGLELRLGQIGKLRIRSKQLHFFRKDGTRSRTLRVNWKATWEYWEKKYPGFTKKELKQTENKPLIYHENEHTNGEFYEHHWDKITCNIPYIGLYDFKPSRQYSRLIAKVVKDPNRKVFYYG
jgi:hypothetical protein